MNYQTLIDDTSTPGITYICKAELGRGTDDPFWQIILIDSNGNKKYPANSNNFPSDKFEFIADNRANLTYSYTGV